MRHGRKIKQADSCHLQSHLQVDKAVCQVHLGTSHGFQLH
jgi:hypothetical protein